MEVDEKCVDHTHLVVRSSVHESLSTLLSEKIAKNHHNCASRGRKPPEYLFMANNHRSGGKSWQETLIRTVRLGKLDSDILGPQSG